MNAWSQWSLLSQNIPQRGRLERLPKWMICIPIGLQWGWLGLRYRSLGLPASANPNITAGGLVGEGKHEYFEQMGQIARASVAPYILCKVTASLDPAALAQQLAAAQLDFPLVIKPDMGLCGYGVRRVNDFASLCRDIGLYPLGIDLVIQAYLSQEGEAGVFYVRRPDQVKGQILGVALRHFPRVIGDGIRTIAELMAEQSRTAALLTRMDHQCDIDVQRVPAVAEVVRLSTIGSTRVGSCYTDGAAFVTPALTEAIDRIAQDMPQFYFGRFDLRFDNLAALQAGRDLKIMEVNGAGSEAIDAWDPQHSLWTGFKMILNKQAILFEIADACRQRGYPVMSLRKILRLNRQQQRLIDQYPPSN